MVSCKCIFNVYRHGHSLMRASSLGTVDLTGTAYKEDFIATGFGGHIAIPILRERYVHVWLQ